MKKEELRPNENFFHTKYGWCYYELHPKSPFIYNLYVHPEYRRKGIATKLLKLVIDDIKKSDFEDDICIEVEPDDKELIEPLLRLYKRLGLRITNEYLLNREDQWNY